MTPSQTLTAAAFLSALMAAAAVWLLLDVPLTPLPDNAVPTAIGSLPVTATDLIEEPDKLPDHAAMRAFFDRQTDLAAALAAGDPVTWQQPSGATGTALPRARHLTDLPAAFWFQLLVGTVALMIGAWIVALRPRDWGARMFALTGLCVPVFTMPAAIYSSRQIALDGEVFRLLSALNHLGAGSFGIALVGLFAMYPRPLVPARWLWLPALVFGALIAWDLTLTAPVKVLDLLVMTQTLLMIALATIQWIRSRRRPLDRAGLRWFVLATTVGVSLFVGLSVLPNTMGLSDRSLIPQGYAFGFFLIMHVGLALGLLRYRVFELDRWAYLIWLWLGSALLVVVVDVVLITAIRMQPGLSLGVAVLFVGFVYFPLRQLLLRWLLSARSPSLTGRMPDILRLALAPDAAGRAAGWDALLQQIFEPMALDVAPRGTPLPAQVQQDGLSLLVPAAMDAGPRIARYAARGRRLFSPDDAVLADTLCELADLVYQSREAFEKGVTSERDRISRDVHDNIGAQILTALHSTEAGRKNELLRDTLTDLRTIINEGFRSRFSLAEVMADLRTESFDRMVPHDITLDWPLDDGAAPGAEDCQAVSLQQANAIRSLVREALSNAIRHSGTRRITIASGVSGGTFRITITDEGKGIALAAGSEGNGLHNMRDRMRALGGSFDVGSLPAQGDGARRGTRLVASFPLMPGKAAVA